MLVEKESDKSLGCGINLIGFRPSAMLILKIDSLIRNT